MSNQPAKKRLKCSVCIIPSTTATLANSKDWELSFLYLMLENQTKSEFKQLLSNNKLTAYGKDTAEHVTIKTEQIPDMLLRKMPVITSTSLAWDTTSFSSTSSDRATNVHGFRFYFRQSGVNQTEKSSRHNLRLRSWQHKYSSVRVGTTLGPCAATVKYNTGNSIRVTPPTDITRNIGVTKLRVPENIYPKHATQPIHKGKWVAPVPREEVERDLVCKYKDEKASNQHMLFCTPKEFVQYQALFDKYERKVNRNYTSASMRGYRYQKKSADLTGGSNNNMFCPPEMSNLIVRCKGNDIGHCACNQSLTPACGCVWDAKVFTRPRQYIRWIMTADFGSNSDSPGTLPRVLYIGKFPDGEKIEFSIDMGESNLYEYHECTKNCDASECKRVETLEPCVITNISQGGYNKENIYTSYTSFCTKHVVFKIRNLHGDYLTYNNWLCNVHKKASEVMAAIRIQNPDFFTTLENPNAPFELVLESDPDISINLETMTCGPDIPVNWLNLILIFTM